MREREERGSGWGGGGEERERESVNQSVSQSVSQSERGTKGQEQERGVSKRKADTQWEAVPMKCSFSVCQGYGSTWNLTGIPNLGFCEFSL